MAIIAEEKRVDFYFKFATINLMAQDLVGKVIHYYDKIGVAVIRLEKALKQGDKVKFVHGENSFEQEVKSMQLDHAPITSGEKGQEVAVKVDQKVSSGTEVYLS